MRGPGELAVPRGFLPASAARAGRVAEAHAALVAETFCGMQSGVLFPTTNHGMI